MSSIQQVVVCHQGPWWQKFQKYLGSRSWKVMEGGEVYRFVCHIPGVILAISERTKYLARSLGPPHLGAPPGSGLLAHAAWRVSVYQ